MEKERKTKMTMKVEEMDTPVVLVDLDVLDRNLQRKAEQAKAAGVKLRPHTKTHKSVWIAREQLKYGAGGITVAKLGEAEVMADGGIDDILIAFPLVGAKKLERLRRLLERGIRVTISTDDVAVARGLSELGESMGRKIPLYVDVNTGLGRCGLEPGEPTVQLVKNIAALPGVEVTGLMTHSGHAYGKSSDEAVRDVARREAEDLVRTRQLLLQEGIDISEVSVGSTPTSDYIGEQSGATEMRPGAYVFGDRSQIATGNITEDQCAMSVLATVVSIPRPGMVIIDAGSKTFGSDVNSHLPGYATLRGNPEVFVDRLSEEHGNVRVPDGMSFSIGDVLQFVPNHCCATTNLHDRLAGVRDGQYVHDIQVDGRGRIR